MTQPSLVRQRPAAVLVIAILHLVGGGLDLLGVVCGGAMQAAGAANPFGKTAPAGPEQVELARLQQQIEALNPPGYIYGELTANFVLDVMLLAAGIGLLSMRPWARTLSLVYAVLAILNRLFTVVFSFVVIIPAFEAMIQEHAPKDPQAQSVISLMKVGMIAGVVFGALFIIYPIVVLIILNLPHVKAAFLGQVEAPPPSLPEDEGWGPIKRPGASTDVTTEPDPDRDRIPPPS
jgi:hypothetical protein